MRASVVGDSWPSFLAEYTGWSRQQVRAVVATVDAVAAELPARRALFEGRALALPELRAAPAGEAER
jgi:hypothetical protein